MLPRLWQRQPGESPADFTAFVSYLRLKGRRSHRAVAGQTGCSLAAIRRLSAQFNWPGRVAAFETRLADATESALDHMVQATSATAQADFERLRISQFLLAHRVIRETRRWLELACDFRRRDVSLTQICQLTDLAFKLARFAVGVGDEPSGCLRRDDSRSCTGGPSLDEALEKIYGSPLPSELPPSPAPAPPVSPQQPVSSAPSEPPVSTTASPNEPQPAAKTPTPLTALDSEPALHAAAGPRRDVWAALARSQRQTITNTKR